VFVKLNLPNQHVYKHRWIMWLIRVVFLWVKFLHFCVFWFDLCSLAVLVRILWFLVAVHFISESAKFELIIIGNFSQVGWAHTTKACRLGSIPGRAIPNTWKMVLAACPVSCSALMGRCKDTVYAWCCHWFATWTAFTVKAAAVPTMQASGNECRRPLVTLRKEYRNQVPDANETELMSI